MNEINKASNHCRLVLEGSSSSRLLAWVLLVIGAMIGSLALKDLELARLFVHELLYCCPSSLILVDLLQVVTFNGRQMPEDILEGDGLRF
jgi:hypothetical protein